jgi:hypothetical protein
VGDIFDSVQATPALSQPASGDIFDAAAPTDNTARQRLALTRPDLVAPPSAAGPSMSMSQVDMSGNPIVEPHYGTGPAQPGNPVVDAVGDAAVGFVKNAARTVTPGPHTAATINNALGTATPANTDAGLQAQGTAQQVGSWAEDAAEFLLGDEALKGLSLGDRLLKVSKVAGEYEKASPFVRSIIDRGMNMLRTGAVAGTEAFAKTSDPAQSAEAAGISAVAQPIIEGVGALAGKATTYGKALASDLSGAIPKDVESKLVSTIGKVAEDAGLEVPEASTLKESVADLGQQFKTRAQGVYKQLDADAPGFQELNDKIKQLETSYKTQLNFDPAKADEIGGMLKNAKTNMDELLTDGQKAMWKAANGDWSRFSALEDVGQGTAKTTSLTSSKLSDAKKLYSNVQSLTNATEHSHPIDKISKAFGDRAGEIRSAVQEGMNITSQSQAAKQFLKWAGIGGTLLTGGYEGVKHALGGK